MHDVACIYLLDDGHATLHADAEIVVPVIQYVSVCEGEDGVEPGIEPESEEVFLLRTERSATQLAHLGSHVGLDVVGDHQRVVRDRSPLRVTLVSAEVTGSERTADVKCGLVLFAVSEARVELLQYFL